MFVYVSMPAPDAGAKHQPDGQAGLHHETARIACAIVVNCKWSGYVTAARGGGNERDHNNGDSGTSAGGQYIVYCNEGIKA